MKNSILIATVAAGFALLACSGRDDSSTTSQDSLDRENTDAAPAPMLTTLSMGDTFACMVARRGVKCWGSNSSMQLTVPALRHPRHVSSGASHACALDDDGVKCWGGNASMQTTVPPLANPRQVSAGSRHTCALDDSGVKCWGSNTSMQTTVPSLRNPRQVSAGSSHTCAIDDDGVKCWGSNTSMQSTPPLLRNPKVIAAGNLHTCALDDSGVKCWGSNSSMQLTPPALRNPKLVTAGSSHSCALDDDGVKCWGSNLSGQTTVPPLRHPTWVASGRTTNCALDDGSVVCWGNNSSGQATIPDDLELFGQHTCMMAAGALRCSGDNEHGQLGVGNDADQAVALASASVTNLGTAFGAPVQTGVGHSFGCALNAAGKVKCWGVNERGQLGLGDKRDRGLVTSDMGDSLPALAFGGATISKIEVGDDHACAVSGAGDLYCWGKGSSGQLGNESTSDVGSAGAPARVRLKSGVTVRALSLGHAHTCVLGSDNAVYCFGDNTAGQLGIGSTTPVGDRAGTMGDALKPVLLGDGFRVKSIAAGDRHACALSDDGRVKCWGAAESGQLGLGDTANRGTSADGMGAALPPVNVGHGQFVVDLGCGARHCCARTIQNTMKCWGDNSFGQLGLGDTAPRGIDASTIGDALPFVMTPPQERVSSIQLEGDRTCARTDSGVRCWGRNRSGELGYGDRNPRGGSFTTIPRLLAPLAL